MARRQQVNVTGVAACGPLPLDLNSSAPFNVSVWVDVGAGCTYTVQITSTEINGPGYTEGSIVWLDHPDATNLATDCAVGIIAPATAVRVNQTVGASTSVVTVLQQGI